MADTKAGTPNVAPGTLQASVRPSLLSAKADAMWSASEFSYLFLATFQSR